MHKRERVKRDSLTSDDRGHGRGEKILDEGMKESRRCRPPWNATDHAFGEAPLARPEVDAQPVVPPVEWVGVGKRGHHVV
ncbi:hypothetical protein V6N12_001130 [Hibiscus sabdariffa]|uniref:Uncharacterized protein n=1 Tax=Hibiscus sabdariffa TaxID=183260 RepID=A0ABR2C6E5_9ROSI